MAGLINFEDEQEVKQFLDNLGVEYSYQCYREKDPEGKSVTIHGCLMRCPWHRGAEKKFGKTCNRAFKANFNWSYVFAFMSFHVVFLIFVLYFPTLMRTPGCQRLADYLEGVKKNYESTAQVLKHNCETNGHGESCYKLGAYYVTGKGNVCFELLLYMPCLERALWVIVVGNFPLV